MINSVHQVNLIARLLKWIIAVDLLICVLLYIPDQTREFYRITVISSLFDSAMLVVWMVLIGMTLWFAARQIVVEAESQLVPPVSKAGRLLIDFGPILLGVAPILLAASAQLQSIPELPKASENMLEVGSVLRIQARELAINTRALRWMSGALGLAALAFIAFSWWLTGKTGGIAATFNRKYFLKPITLLVTVVLIALTEVMFVESPVEFSQFVKLFGIVAIFTICVSSFVIHVTLLTDRYRIAFLPIVLIMSAMIAALVLNDNHTVREVTTEAKAANSPVLKDAGDVFVEWLKRPDRLTYAKSAAASTYPVFVVAAQGGGAYAAYNAAVFLARIQDLCPAFRHHLFAVSSVSGGSIGAATFAAALNAEDVAGRTANLEQSNSQGFLSANLQIFIERACCQGSWRTRRSGNCRKRSPAIRLSFPTGGCNPLSGFYASVLALPRSSV
jgi:hypothetical protein